MRTDDLYILPDTIPIPKDDGLCEHLFGKVLSSITLNATSGEMVDLSNEGHSCTVVFCYPGTGCPDQEPPGGAAAWNSIPGARGCTPQSCSYRDHFKAIEALGTKVFGLSTQNTEYQLEAVQRLHLQFPLLSDTRLNMLRALRLPTFICTGLELIKRLTLIIRAGKIEHVFYPVFPPNKDAKQAIEWLSSHYDKH